MIRNAFYLLILSLSFSSSIFAYGVVREAYLTPTAKKKIYIPFHHIDDFMEVKSWAVGGAFSLYAKKAGYSFNEKNYLEHCPHPELFGFGVVTGNLYLKYDIKNDFITMAELLKRAYQKSKLEFPSKFYQMALEAGFEQYLTREPAQ